MNAALLALATCADLLACVLRALSAATAAFSSSLQAEGQQCPDSLAGIEWRTR